MKDYNLFVAGIPYGINSRAIEVCFATLGYQVKVRTEESITGEGCENQNSILCQGYCVIRPRDQSTYYSILKNKGIQFQGRTLICKPYLEGDSLYRQNAYNNKRRVILKGIPVQISTDSVLELLEWVYGPVEKMYKFLSDKVDSQREIPTNGQKFMSLSVMFWDKEAAKKASADKYCQVKGFKIGIEAFQSKKKRRKMATDLKIVPTKAELGSLRPLGSKDEVGSKPSFPMLDQEERRILSFSKVDSRGKTLQSLADFAIMKKERTSHSTPCKISRGVSGVHRHEFLQEIIRFAHHIKPTSRIFKLLRSEFSEYTAMFELRDTWIARTNQRYNKEKPR